MMFKRFASILSIAITALSYSSQAALLYNFNFNNGLSSTNGNATLTGTGSIVDGQYMLEALPSNYTSIGLYGLELGAEKSRFTSNDYRIDFSLKFDGTLSDIATFTGWKKILDFSSRKLDEGVYIWGDNEAGVYPSHLNNLQTKLRDDAEYLFSFTRDASTNEFSMYINNELITSFIDSSEIGVTNGETLTFLMDDRGGWETIVNASIDNIRIYDSLDATAAVPIEHSFSIFLLALGAMAFRNRQQTLKNAVGQNNLK